LESLKGRDHSEDLGVDGKVIFKWILKKYGRWVAVDWTDVAQDKDRLRDLVNTVRIFQFHKRLGI
jgi:hypothetical protein